MTLGKKLMNLRTTKNLTRERLSQELGISKTAYGKWESDLAKPNFDHISVICDFYGISKDELMNEEKQIFQNNNTFNNSPNFINSQNPTINYTLPNEVIENLLNNQKLITDLVENQNILFKKIASN